VAALRILDICRDAMEDDQVYNLVVDGEELLVAIDRARGLEDTGTFEKPC